MTYCNEKLKEKIGNNILKLKNFNFKFLFYFFYLLFYLNGN